VSAGGRFVVVSGYFPPLIGGTATVMRELLGAFDPARFGVIAEKPDAFDGTHNATVPPGIEVLRAGVPGWIKRLPYGLRAVRWLRFALVPRLVRMILAQRPERIIAVLPSWPFLLAAYFAHQRSGVPFYTYWMDASVKAERLGLPDRWVVARYERAILAAARQRLVLSEALQEDFRQRFGMESTVIPHPIALTEGIGEFQRSTDERLIVHTGVVEALQREGLRRVQAAILANPEWKTQLVLSTPTDPADLGEFHAARIATLPGAEVRALQRRAAVLVAALPFADSHESLRRTAFPTKVVEYLTTGVPILAHAPPDSFFARHVRQHGYALLVDEPTEAAVQAGLTRLLTDDALCRELTTRAQRFVQDVHALPRVATAFARACEIDPAALRP